MRPCRPVVGRGEQVRRTPDRCVTPALRADLLAELPVMAERVRDAPRAPTILLMDGRDLLRPPGERPFEERVGIADRQDDPNRAARARFRADLWVLLDPERRV